MVLEDGDTEPGGLPICLEMTLIDSPARQRRHKSAFISSDIAGGPILATHTVLNQHCCNHWLNLRRLCSRQARPATHSLVAFIDEYKRRFGGVEPICRVLTDHDCKIAPSTYYAHHTRQARPAARTLRDTELKRLIREAYEANYRVYGARKIWRHLNRQDVAVARCTVERLMRDLGITGAVRGKKVITTIPDANVPIDGIAADYPRWPQVVCGRRRTLHPRPGPLQRPARRGLIGARVAHLVPPAR
ncbi:IS3 family transposase [Streptomyces sp. NPDC057717]|uniref:IS3 family transposase n=1 Tax=Streptomyces sp. NPDC057717 TaxID=3346224 RepID=UPI003680D6E8